MLTKLNIVFCIKKILKNFLNISDFSFAYTDSKDNRKQMFSTCLEQEKLIEFHKYMNDHQSEQEGIFYDIPQEDEVSKSFLPENFEGTTFILRNKFSETETFRAMIHIGSSHAKLFYKYLQYSTTNKFLKMFITKAAIITYKMQFHPTKQSLL